MEQILTAKLSESRRHAFVFETILAIPMGHQDVDPSVSPTLNAHETLLASIPNVKILVLVLVERRPFVML